jgi:hypothetical protein
MVHVAHTEEGYKICRDLEALGIAGRKKKKCALNSPGSEQGPAGSFFI